MWSRQYDKCSECSTTDRKHYGGGLCWRCYNRSKYKEDPAPARKRARKYYELNSLRCRRSAARRYALKKDEIVEANKKRSDRREFGGIKLAVMDRDGNACVRCGSGTGLVVHHIDGSGRGKTQHNNSMSNLETLCRACHSREHKPRLGTGKVKI